LEVKLGTRARVGAVAGRGGSFGVSAEGFKAGQGPILESTSPAGSEPAQRVRLERTKLSFDLGALPLYLTLEGVRLAR
jgi:hypothetical protein